MFEVWTVKNQEHIINYPKIEDELNMETEIIMIKKMVDDIISDFEEYSEGIYRDYELEEMKEFKELKPGRYSFYCGDFSYRIVIE